MNHHQWKCIIMIFLFAFHLSYVAEAKERQKPKKNYLECPIVVYDLQTGKVGLEGIERNWIHYGENVIVKVINYNPFLYDLQVNNEVVSFHQTIPQILSINLSGKAPSEAPPDKTAYEKEREDIKGKLELAIKQKKELKQNRAAVEKKELEIKELGISKTNLDKKIDYIQSLGDFRTALQDVYLKLPSLERCILDALGFSDDLAKENLLAQLTGIAENILGTCHKTPEQAYLQAKKLAEIVLSKWENLESAYEILDSTSKEEHKASFEVEKKHWQIYRDSDQTKLVQGVENAISIWRAVMQTPFESSTGPFMARGDELRIKVMVSRKANLDARYLTRHVSGEKQVACLRTYCGIKLDFSAGFFFSTLTDRAYGTHLNDKGEAVIIRLKEEEDTFAVSAGALIHVYPRSKLPINFALSFGLGTLKTNELGYFLGLSSLLGQEQRGILTLGVACGKVSSLGGGYKEGDILPSTVSTIPTRQTTKLGYFLSFSYNWGGTSSK